MSLSNCWTQGCKAIFISSVNLCFCSQQQSHTIYKWSKTIEWVNKIKWSKLPEAEVCSRGNNQPVFWTTHHTLGDWNKSSGRSLQETSKNCLPGASPPFCKKGLGWVLLGFKHTLTADNSHSISYFTSQVENLTYPGIPKGVTAYWQSWQIWQPQGRCSQATQTSSNTLVSFILGHFDLWLQWQIK